MFSNGTEYLDFLGAFCEKCNKYKEGVENEECCPVEYQISLTSITGNKKDFPYKNLKPIGNSCRYACKEFNCDDEELMKTYNEIMS